MTVLKKMRSVYLQEVLLKDYKCFHGVNKFSFVLNPAERVLRYPRCTVFLGDNGTGKTNLLKVIANLAPEIRRVDDEEYKKEGKNDIALEVAFGNTTQEEPLHEKAYRPHVVERYTGKGYNAEVIFAFNKGVGQRITNLKFENLYKKKEINGSYEVRDQVKIGYNATTNTIQYDVPSLENVVIYAYGVNRFSDTQNNLKTDNFVDTLFYDDCPLINVNQWLLQLELAKQSKNQGIRARRRISIITDVLRKSNLFPDVQGYDVVVDGDLNTDVLFKTSLGNFHLQDLAYGYQCMFAWVFDFIKKMFDRYPDSQYPLSEPAILIVDEIDLHLHPEWQRHVLHDLCDLFPNTQIIVSTHSPLVIQSMDNINLYAFSKGEQGTEVTSYLGKSFMGWKVDEILREVMQLGDKVRSDRYNQIRQEFEHAMTRGKNEEAVKKYKELMQMVNPNSSEAALLDMDYAQLKG